MIWLAASLAMLAVIARGLDRMLRDARRIAREQAGPHAAVGGRRGGRRRSRPRRRRAARRADDAGGAGRDCGRRRRAGAPAARGCNWRSASRCRRADVGLVAALFAAIAPRLWAGLHRTTFLYDTLSYHLHVPGDLDELRTHRDRPRRVRRSVARVRAEQPRAGVPVPDEPAALRLSRRRRAGPVRGAGRGRDRRDRARGRWPPDHRARRGAGVRPDSRGVEPGADRDDRPGSGGVSCCRRCRSPSGCGGPGCPAAPTCSCSPSPSAWRSAANTRASRSPCPSSRSA